MFDPATGRLEDEFRTTFPAMRAVRDNDDLTTYEAVVLLMFLLRANPHRDERWEVYLSLDGIADDAKCARSTAQVAVYGLVAKGLIHADGAAGRATITYVLDHHAILALPARPKRVESRNRGGRPRKVRP